MTKSDTSTSVQEGVTMAEEEQLLRAEEVAALLNVPKSAVYAAARNGTLTCVHFGRYVRFAPSVIRAFIAAGGKAVES